MIPNAFALLAEPGVGNFFRHPVIVAIFVTLPILLLVGPVNVALGRESTDAIWQYIKFVIAVIPLLVFVLWQISSMVDGLKLMLDEKRFLHEMRTLLIMLEAELLETQSTPSSNS